MSFTYAYQTTITNGVRVYDEKLKKVGLVATTTYYDKVNYYQRLARGVDTYRNFDKVEITYDGEGSNTLYFGEACNSIALESATAGAAYAKLKLRYR